MTRAPPDDRLARALRGFGPAGIATFLVVALIGPGWFRGILVLVWARLAHVPWRDIGYVRPTSWSRTVVIGIAFGSVFKLLMKAVVMPLLGADPINHVYHFLAGNRGALAGMLVTVTVSAGFGEETVFRGYFFERFRKLFGKSRAATMAIILLTSALFALAHYADQRLAGAEQAFITGLVFGVIFAVTHQLWFVMIAHAAFDVTAVMIIYYGLESRVAHLFFN